MGKKLGHLTALEGLYNSRVKYYYDSGEWVPVEVMTCSLPIFNPDGLEKRFDSENLRLQEPTSEFEKVARARARAKSKLNDLIMCNDFKWFTTLTLSPDQIDRTDYSQVVKKLNNYLGNRVKRNGLNYVGVAELHKKGGFHFHFLMNDSLKLVHSGTYLRPRGGKPVKAETLKRQGLTVEECRDVYNIKDWKLGFTTAIELYGDKGAVASYVGKYITKSDCKVGGRWYYSGGDLRRPRFTYDRIDFETFEGDYKLNTPTSEIKVKKL